MPLLQNSTTTVKSRESVLATNAVLRNTYMLLSLTLLFSGAIATWVAAAHIPSPGIIISLVGMFGLVFLTMALRNSAWGILAIFAFTGFMGYMLGPTLDLYLKTYINGGQLIATALGGTGVIFLGLSAYVLTTRKDFSYLGGFLFIALIGAIVLSITGLLFKMPVLTLAISAVFILIFSGFILYDTSRIIHGGERNYIMATVALYLDIFNLFVSLLNILGAFSGNRN